MQLIKSPFVLTAALREPKVNQPSIQREDARHHAVAWLGEVIQVKCPDEKTGILTVSLTSSDPREAAALVNAVVNAYWNEVVQYEQMRRRVRLSELQAISAKKGEEVRAKREQLKRELEALGYGDDQTITARTQLAISIYAQFQSEFQKMRAEHRSLLGKIAEAKAALKDLPAAEIAAIEVAALLNKDPAFRDLQQRRTLLELESDKLHASGGTATTEERRIAADLEKTKQQMQQLRTETREAIRDAKCIALNQEISRLKIKVGISEDNLASFAKEVEKKEEIVESLGKSSINVQMERADIANIEHLLRGAAEERERLKVEVDARPRVRIMGDPTAPAAVPESPD